MIWSVVLSAEFALEFDEFSAELQDEMMAHIILLQQFGPDLGRPFVDHLKGSRYANMKELRFQWRTGVWRLAFAFDPDRRAILLAAADKTGIDQRRFYKRLIGLADRRFAVHIEAMRKR